MKRLASFGIGLVFAMTALAPAASAGVVMSETSVAAGPAGGSIQQRTIYVQGNKQKVEKPGVDAITDLDKGVIYVVDKNHKQYVEMPLRKAPADGVRHGSSGLQEFHLDKTGKTRVIANQRCTEYRGGESTEVEKVAISACVSRNAPGANEVSAFERNALSRVEGVAPKNSGNEGAAGLLMEKISVVSLRMPDPSQTNAYRTASFLSRTEVTGIQVKQLSDDLFQPPKNFVQVRSVPRNHNPRPSEPNRPGNNNVQVRNQDPIYRHNGRILVPLPPLGRG